MITLSFSKKSRGWIEHRNVSDAEELSLIQERLQLTINELLYMQLNSNDSTISNIAVDEIIQNLTVLLEQIRRDLIPGTNPNLDSPVTIELTLKTKV